MLAPDALIRRSPAAIEAPVGDATVLHDCDTGAYTRLNASAAVVWSAFAEPATAVAAARALGVRYGLGSSAAWLDATATVEALLERGLLELAS